MDFSHSNDYTLLKETKAENKYEKGIKKKYNIAGIVIDATQPYKTSKTLIVSLKIVDPSI